MEYEKVLKHLKKITHTKEPSLKVSPVLKGVYHKDNSVRATDKHRIIYAEINNAEFDEAVIDTKTNETITDRFPNTDNLFVSEGDIDLFVYSEVIAEMKTILNCIKSLKYKRVNIVKEADNWYLEPRRNDNEEIAKHDRTAIRYTIAKDTTSQEQTRVFSTEYLLNIIDFIKDTKEDTRITMQENQLMPIQFSNIAYNDFKYKYVVMPIRIYS